MFMMKELTPAQRVQKATVDIMAKDRYVALAGILMIGTKTVETNATKCPTAYTDGKNVVFGADFIEGLNDAELRFLVLHEEYHKLYRHLTTWRWMYKENPQLANMACDYVINCKLYDDNESDKFATMTGELKKGCLNEKYRGWDAAQVFHDLKKNPPPQGGGQGQFAHEQGHASGDIGEHTKCHDRGQPDAVVLRVAVDVLEAVALAIGHRHEFNDTKPGVVRHTGRFIKVVPA